MFKRNYVIEANELEAGYHHLNHAATLTLLERARLEYLKEVGFPNEMLHSQGIFLVISKITIQYLREIFAGDVLVTIENVACHGKKMTIDQKAYNSRNKALVDSSYNSVCLMAKTKRSVLIPKDLERAMTLSLS